MSNDFKLFQDEDDCYCDITLDNLVRLCNDAAVNKHGHLVHVLYQLPKQQPFHVQITLHHSETLKVYKDIPHQTLLAMYLELKNRTWMENFTLNVRRLIRYFKFWSKS